MGGGMDESMETLRTRSDGAVCIRMLGSFAIHRDGFKLTLPSSRKVRALLAYLALAHRPVARERLCELLWEIPNDPKGELRWTLSKIRGLLDTTDIQRVRADGDGIALDLSGCAVDAFDIVQAEKAPFSARNGTDVQLRRGAHWNDVTHRGRIDSLRTYPCWISSIASVSSAATAK
jgi:DNA-binding SARP family transcriptional activator